MDSEKADIPGSKSCSTVDHLGKGVAMFSIARMQPCRPTVISNR